MMYMILLINSIIFFVFFSFCWADVATPFGQSRWLRAPLLRCIQVQQIDFSTTAVTVIAVAVAVAVVGTTQESEAFRRSSAVHWSAERSVFLSSESILAICSSSRISSKKVGRKSIADLKKNVYAKVNNCEVLKLMIHYICRYYS